MGTLLTILAVGIATIVVASIVLAVVSTAFALAWSAAMFLLFKVAPVLLVGWVVLKVIERARTPSLSAADRKWLEGGD
jgi:hypothetical protein